MSSLTSLSHALLERRGLSLTLGALLLCAGVLLSPLSEPLLRAIPALAPLRGAISVDALPFLGEQQQLITARWEGRSPEEVEEELTYPLTMTLLGATGVKSVRSRSMFGWASLTVIFEDGVESARARATLVERLSALDERLLPAGVTPRLGPDATPLGQVLWYVIEPRVSSASAAQGVWSLEERRVIQDTLIKPALEGVEGVAEVSSVGGYLREYVVESDPERLERYGLTLSDLTRAVREAHLDVGVGSLEMNGVEHLTRGLGELQGRGDLERAVVVRRKRALRNAQKTGGGLEVVTLGELANVSLSPQRRRGALDLNGAETVGGVVVATEGANPREVVERVKEALKKLTPSLPRRGRAARTTAASTTAGELKPPLELHVVYDRAVLINETLGTLTSTLTQQLTLTLIVVMLVLGRLSTALVMSSVMPFAVALTFCLMWLFGVSANVMSLSGIAIAIGTMIDMSVVLTERFVRLSEARVEGSSRRAVALSERLSLLKEVVRELAPTLTTSTLTTLLSFLPIIALQGAEGQLFRPLVYTKSLAIMSALCCALLLLPVLMSFKRKGRSAGRSGVSPSWARAGLSQLWRVTLIGGALYVLSSVWRVSGAGEGAWSSLGWTAGLTAVGLSPFLLFKRLYPPLLRWALAHKALALSAPLSLMIFGAVCLFGAPTWAPQSLQRALPGLEREFMPAFDEGEFIYMPTLPPHASVSEALRSLRLLDARLAAIPEVRQVLGKLGRVESALDPAPPSMFEVLISYHPEYVTTPNGAQRRAWRPHIKRPDDIWREVVSEGEALGLTSAPKLMPIETRLVMLESGLRAPLGLKLQSHSAAALARAGRALEPLLKTLPSVEPSTVFVERLEGQPTLELTTDRDALIRYGLTSAEVQRAFLLAVRGERAVTITQGRERLEVVVRGDRRYRHDLSALKQLPVPLPLTFTSGERGGASVPLSEVASLSFRRGPQALKGEGGSKVSYLTFGERAGVPQGEAMSEVLSALQGAQAQRGALAQALEGVVVSPEGVYVSQQRSEARLTLLVPLAALLILLTLYQQLKGWFLVGAVYAGVFVSLAGAFALMWLYGQPWLAELSVAGVSLRELLSVAPVRLSVAVWVGVIALLGVATDDGLLMASALKESVAERAPQSVEQVRAQTYEVALARLTPCLITTMTTLLALLPVMTSQGRGADLMRPMALPSIGGMLAELLTLFVVPLLFCAQQERRLKALAHVTQAPQAPSAPPPHA